MTNSRTRYGDALLSMQYIYYTPPAVNASSMPNMDFALKLKRSFAD